MPRLAECQRNMTVFSVRPCPRVLTEHGTGEVPFTPLHSSCHQHLLHCIPMQIMSSASLSLKFYTFPPKAGTSVSDPCHWASPWLETELQSGSIFGGERRQVLPLWVPPVPSVTHFPGNSSGLRDKVRSSSRESRFDFE